MQATGIDVLVGGSAKWVLFIGLAAFGLAKVLGGHSPQYGMSAWAYYGTAVAELTLAVALLGRWQAWASWAAVCLFAGGVVFAMVERRHPCGCLGHVVSLAWRDHLMLAGSFGIIATLAAEHAGRRMRRSA